MVNIELFFVYEILVLFKGTSIKTIWLLDLLLYKKYMKKMFKMYGAYALALLPLYLKANVLYGRSLSTIQHSCQHDILFIIRAYSNDSSLTAKFIVMGFLKILGNWDRNVSIAIQTSKTYSTEAWRWTRNVHVVTIIFGYQWIFNLFLFKVVFLSKMEWIF